MQCFLAPQEVMDHFYSFCTGKIVPPRGQQMFQKLTNQSLRVTIHDRAYNLIKGSHVEIELSSKKLCLPSQQSLWNFQLEESVNSDKLFKNVKPCTQALDSDLSSKPPSAQNKLWPESFKATLFSSADKKGGKIIMLTS